VARHEILQCQRDLRAGGGGDERPDHHDRDGGAHAARRHAFGRGKTVLLLEGEVGAEHQRSATEEHEAVLHDGPRDDQCRERSERGARHERGAAADAFHEQCRRNRGDGEAYDGQRDWQCGELRHRRQLAAEDAAQQEHGHHAGRGQGLRDREHVDVAHAGQA
jgi:hypothetical protein